MARISELRLIGASIGSAFRDEIPSRGFKFRTQGLAYQTKSQLLFRTYESAEIRAVQRHLRRDLDVIELGAGIGVVSCHIRRHINPTQHLYCVEANSAAAQIIDDNLALNGMTSGVTVVNAALAHTAEHVHFIRGATIADGRIAESSCSCQGNSVPAVTLKTLLSRFGIHQYALVCDIEGSEAAMIATDSYALRKCVQIIIELHHSRYLDRQYEPDELLHALCDLSFCLRTRDGNVCVLDRR